jgi:hypothetical protein
MSVENIVTTTMASPTKQKRPVSTAASFEYSDLNIL